MNHMPTQTPKQTYCSPKVFNYGSLQAITQNRGCSGRLDNNGFHWFGCPGPLTGRNFYTSAG